MNTNTKLIKQLRSLEEEDHETDWIVAVTMRDISSLLDLIEAQAKQIEELKEDMEFIERAAVYYGSRKMGGLTPKQALSMIQHYPPIVEITESYNEEETK
jgi:hypothetical protein